MNPCFIIIFYYYYYFLSCPDVISFPYRTGKTLLRMQNLTNLVVVTFCS